MKCAWNCWKVDAHTEHSYTAVTWFFFFLLWLFRLYSPNVCMHSLCSRSLPQAGATDTRCSFCPTLSTKPVSWAWSWWLFSIIFVLSFVWGLVQEVLLVDGLFYRVAWARCQFWFFCKCSIVGGYLQNGALLCFHLSKPFQSGLKSQGWYSPCLCMPIKSGMKHVGHATVCLCTTEYRVSVGNIWDRNSVGLVCCKCRRLSVPLVSAPSRNAATSESKFSFLKLPAPKLVPRCSTFV